MFKHWTGTFFKDADLNNESFIINNQVWKEIGQTMHDFRKQIPLEFGRPSRNIFKYHNGFKAAEWSSWVTMFSIPLLKSKLSERYLIDPNTGFNFYL